MKARKRISNLIGTAALTALLFGVGGLLPAAAETVKKKDLSIEALAELEERASTQADFERLGQLWRMRAEMLHEKANKHEKLEQRYASAPKSLIAKRGHGWNTPKRQRILGEKARRQAVEAKQMAEQHLAQADGLSTDVD